MHYCDNIKTVSKVNNLGNLCNRVVNLHINENVKPVNQKHLRIAFHMRKSLEKELIRLSNTDIIGPAEGPTPWVSPTVVVPKQQFLLKYRSTPHSTTEESPFQLIFKRQINNFLPSLQQIQKHDEEITQKETLKRQQRNNATQKKNMKRHNFHI